MIDDLKILETQLEGLKKTGTDLRSKENLFIKAQGIDETIQRNQKEKQTLESSLKKKKDALKKLKADKKDSLNTVSKKICDKLNEFLPVGKSFFDAYNKLYFGWVYDDVKQGYNSLSGAQKHIFDAALENVLGSNIIIIEAAEMDQQHLETLLEELINVDKQVFINTWFDDFKSPDCFEIVNL